MQNQSNSSKIDQRQLRQIFSIPDYFQLDRYSLTQIKKIQKYQKKKIKELYQTEKQYIKVLKILDGKIHQIAQQYLNEEQMQKIFGEIKSLLSLHENYFLPLLIKYSEEIFLPYKLLEGILVLFHGLNMYKIYSSNHNSVLSLLDQLKKNKNKFIKMIEKSENKEEFDYYDLNQMLYYPISRIFHYQCFFQDMIKYTNLNDPIFIKIRKIFKIIKNVNTEIEQWLVNKDFEDELFQKLVKFNLVYLKQQNQKIEFQTTLFQVEGDQFTQMEFILITNLIIIHDKHQENFKIMHLNQESYCKKFQNSKTLKNIIIIFGIDNCFLLQTTSDFQSQLLFQKIQQVLFNLSVRYHRKLNQNTDSQYESQQNVQEQIFNEKIQNEYNQDKLFIETLGMLFRDSRIIYILRLKICNYYQFFFLSYSQIKQLVNYLQNNFPAINIPKFGKKSNPVVRMIKFQFLLCYVLNNQHIKQHYKDVLKIINIDASFYKVENSQQINTVHQFWIQSLQSSILQNDQSIQNIMLKIIQRQKRVYSNFQDSFYNQNITIQFLNGKSINIPYNSQTKVIHVIYQIINKKNIHSALDFDIYIKIPTKNITINLDQDNFIFQLINDYKDINFEFVFQKTLYFPLKNELIDFNVDIIRQELVYYQTLQEIQNENIQLNFQKYISLVARCILIEYIIDNRIKIQSFLKKSYLKTILPINFIQQNNFQNLIQHIKNEIEDIAKYLNINQFENIKQQLINSKQRKISSLFNIFNLKLNKSKKDTKSNQTRLRSRSLSQSYFLIEQQFKLEQLDIDERKQIFKYQQEIIIFLEQNESYGYKSYKYICIECENLNQDETYDLMINYNHIKVVQDKKKKPLFEFNYQMIQKVVYEDFDLAVKNVQLDLFKK